MRVVVLSSTSFGYECIKRGVLTTPAVQLAGILTTPSSIKFSKSGSPMSISKHSTFEDLGALAGCEVVELAGDITESIYRPHLDRWCPDLILVLGWYYMLPRKVREKAALGCMGVHASLLPMYRGWAPISWAIINGETETGVTLFHLEDEVDSGDVVAQESFAIDREDTCATVYEKAVEASIRILRELLPQIAVDKAPRIVQNAGDASYFPRRRPEDGLIDWSKTPEQIRNFIRAQTKPYPGAFSHIGGKKVTIWDADISFANH